MRKNKTDQRIESSDSVKRLLVSSDDSSLMRFHLQVCMIVNVIERRKQTVLYTCMKEDFDFVFQVAKKSNVTMQEINRVDGKEVYQILIQGNATGWKNG